MCRWKAQASPGARFRRKRRLRIPVDASLDAARLRMTATGSSGAVVSAKPGSTNNWSETGMTWSNAPGYGLRTDNSPAVATGPVEWDLSDYVSGNGVYSVILTQASSTQTSFSARETANPPQLELTYRGTVATTTSVISEPAGTAKLRPSSANAVVTA